MSAFEDFLGGARRALESLREAYGLVQEAKSKNAEARSQLASATEGTGNAAIDASLTRLDAITEALHDATTHTVGGVEEFKAYLAEIGAGAALADTADSPAPSPTQPASPVVREPVAHNRFQPEGMDGLRPYSEAGTAEGNLFFDEGKWNDKPIKATPGRSAFRPGEVRPGWEGKKPADGGHVEGIAAAAMLHSERTEASLYLNAEPCDWAGEGCKENAAHFMKPGNVLWVHVQHENGSRFRKRITGTGRALSDDNPNA